MDLQKDIDEGLQFLNELNRQMKEISDKIGALQEQGKALHGKALEVKGGIESLARLQEREKQAAAKLVLPDKTLVAADGKTPIAAPVVEEQTANPVADPKAPPLEVVQ